MGSEAYLYVVATLHGEEWSAPIKVGFTTNLKERLRMVRTGCPYRATFFQIWEMGGVPAAKFIEGAFHHLQREHRLSGEWFSVDPRTACFLIEMYVRQSFVLSGAATPTEVDEELGGIANYIPEQPIWPA